MILADIGEMCDIVLEMTPDVHTHRDAEGCVCI